ncbi:MAG: hypothetical protein U1E76_15510 [Planctomycetota bacterium]
MRCPLYAGIFAGPDGTWRNRAAARDGDDTEGDPACTPGSRTAGPTTPASSTASADELGRPRDAERALVWWRPGTGTGPDTTPLMPD